jgi:hypothetical protein
MQSCFTHLNSQIGPSILPSFGGDPGSVSNSDVPMSSLQATERDHQPNSQSPPNISPDWDRRWLRKRKVEEEQKIPVGFVIFPLGIF